jgi:hypothetical protein
MIARRLTLTAAVSLCALAGWLVFAGAAAQALVTHDYAPAVSAQINEGIPVEGPHGEKIAQPGPLELAPLSMIVDSGHLWTVEGSDRIDEFDAATGAFLSQLTTHPEGVLFGVGNSASAGIAVGHLGGEAQVYVGESGAGSAVGVYDESGTLEGTWTGAGTPAGSFSREGMDVAIDDSTDPLDERKGDVYVASDQQGSTPAVIDVFHPEADGKEHYVGQITGLSPSEPFEEIGRVAVDDTNGDVVVIANKAVDIFEPAALGEYLLVHKITGSPGGSFSGPFNLSVDGANGDIYIDDLGFEGLGAVVDQFSDTGAYLGRIIGADAPHGGIDDVFAIAVDSASHNVYVGDSGFREMEVFGADIVFPDVTTDAPSTVTPYGATLDGTVDPLSAGAATCRFEWGPSKLFGKTAPCEPEGVADGGSPVSVHATLSGLAPDRTYFYRLQATNANGTNAGEASQDQEFTTPGPGIDDESVTDLASTSVTFGASLNPHGVPSSYYFQYGTSTSYGTDVPAPPGEAIGSGEGDIDVTPRHVQELQPGTLYHYRVVVLTEPHAGEVVVFDGTDQTFRTQTAAVSELPDGRHWEMVSPPDKKGARIYPILENGVEQAAGEGGAISYLADIPTESEAQGDTNEVQVLSTRGPAGWTTRDIALPHNGFTGKSVGGGEEYRLFSEDLSTAAVQPFGSFVAGLSAEASESTAMLHTLDGACASSCYQPLVTGEPGHANVPPGVVFGEEPKGECPGIYCGPAFISATPDLAHVLLSSSAPLQPGAGSSQVYEWSGGELTLVSVMPDGTPSSTLSPGIGDNTRGAISRDGSRVVLSASFGGAIYMRDVALGKTFQLNVAEPACVAREKCVSGGGQFQLASADGSKVFFTNQSGGYDPHRLLESSGKVGSDLYECEVVEKAGEPECKLSDIATEAVGVLGASEDGAYVYFVANSVLAAGAAPGECEAGGTPRAGATCNLYVRHDGVTKFVALLSPEDSHDWSSELGGLSARVSPDGHWAEFMSQRSVTGYDNLDAINGKPDAEVYLYDASAGRVVCASCDPTGARPTGAEYFLLEPGSGGLTGGPRGVWSSSGWVAATVPGWLQFRIGDSANQPRYLSDSGRLFFNSGDALVPQDVNGTQDVYEYEPPGVGDCTASSATFDEGSHGCVGLISSGTSAEESGFLEASATGGDVFFLTFSKLQPQDYDNSLDVYDAHECTSAVPCFATAVPQPPACTTADACRAAPAPQPAAFGAPSSATFSGAGNVTPAATTGGRVTAKSLTRAQKLAKALSACKKRPKRKRAKCEKSARAQYGPAHSGKRAPKRKGNR